MFIKDNINDNKLTDNEINEAWDFGFLDIINPMKFQHKWQNFISTYLVEKHDRTF